MIQVLAKLPPWLKICFIALVLAACFFVWGRASAIEIYVTPGIKMKSYKAAFIDVQVLQGESADKKRSDEGHSLVEDEIWQAMKNWGIQANYASWVNKNPLNTDMLVNCFYDYAWGPPATIRHFGFKFKFRKHITIEFLDAQTKKLLVKAQYTRGFAGYDDGDIKKIFNSIEDKLKSTGSL